MSDTTNRVFPHYSFTTTAAVWATCALVLTASGCGASPRGPQAAETHLTTSRSTTLTTPLDIHILGSAAEVSVLPLPAEATNTTQEPIMIKVTSDNDQAALPLVTQPTTERYEVRSDLGDEASSSHITVLLHADATWNVSLDAPVDTFTADFTALNIHELHLSESVATATVTTPQERDISIEQSGGAGQVTVIAPETAVPHVTFDVGYGQATIDETTFTSGEVISLPPRDVDGSPQITVNHTAGIGQFTLQRR